MNDFTKTMEVVAREAHQVFAVMGTGDRTGRCSPAASFDECPDPLCTQVREAIQSGRNLLIELEKHTWDSLRWRALSAAILRCKGKQ